MFYHDDNLSKSKDISSTFLLMRCGVLLIFFLNVPYEKEKYIFTFSVVYGFVIVW